jgi:hypothetical protein
MTMELFKRIALAVILAFLPLSAEAATYWIHPDGASTWNAAGCQKETDPGAGKYCSLATANTSAVAGDIVNMRGGSYSVAQFGSGIIPSNSGSSGNVITFRKVPGETPIITTAATIVYGIYINGKSYLKLDGITFQNIPTWGYIIGGSHYNEVTNCTFTATEGNEAGSFGILISGAIGGSCATSMDCWNTHNWFHGNTFEKRKQADPCAEGIDLFRIGGAYTTGKDAENNNYNTIEDNTFSGGVHTSLDNFGMYNVIRNNIFHNEPWNSGCTASWQDDTSTTELTIGTGSKTLTLVTGITFSGGTNYVTILSAAGYGNAMHGVVDSYNAGTKALTVTVDYVAGSGTFSDWVIAYDANVPFYTVSAYNNLFGHRNLQLTNDYARDGTYVLVEGNRIGHASNNPANNGPANFDAASAKNIIRYNDLYNGMAAGISLKYNKSDVDCATKVGNSSCAGKQRIYNNTIYNNGKGYDYSVYSAKNNAIMMLGIAQYDQDSGGAVGNVIKNNLLYSNGQGDICGVGWKSGACTAESYDTVANNWLQANGDPLFTDPDLTAPTSTTLPDLTLQAASTAKEAGTYLTLANGAGTNSTTLIVDDALYFQDGTWGSSLSTIAADWIKVGTVTVQISSINYATNTITLASAITWADNAEIRLYKKSDGVQVLYGAETDMGAHEYAGATTHTITASKTGSGGNLTPTGEEIVGDGQNSGVYTASIDDGIRGTWSGTCGATGTFTAKTGTKTYQKENTTGDCTVVVTFETIKIGGVVKP